MRRWTLSILIGMLVVSGCSDDEDGTADSTDVGSDASSDMGTDVSSDMGTDASVDSLGDLSTDGSGDLAACEGCWIGGSCYADEEVNPENPCEICDTSDNAENWADNDGAECDDEVFCNGADTCLGGVCDGHDGDPCADDGDWCTGDESCDLDEDECTHSGSPCTEDQLCDGPNTQCCDPEDGWTCNDDGDVVWLDSCEREGGVVEDCDETRGICLDEEGRCACDPGWTGADCSRCLIYVDGQDGDDEADGDSWDQALATVSAALDDADDAGCEIWVTGDRYTPLGEGRSATFELRGSVGLYGGFAGDEVLRDQRDTMTNVSVLSGDLGEMGDPSDNAYHVLAALAGTDGAVVDGFIVQDGHADHESEADDQCGGGMLIKGASPMVSDVSFFQHSARRGGAICLLDASPTFDGVSVDSNVALDGSGGSDGGDGGALYVDAGSPTFIDVAFGGNQAGDGGNGTSGGGDGGRGGAVFISDATPTFDTCFFMMNTAGEGGDSVEPGGGGNGGDGGAVFVLDSDPLFADCYFDANVTGAAGVGDNVFGDAGDGGALFNLGSTVVVRGGYFNFNATAAGPGGLNDGGDGGSGGAIFSENSPLTVSGTQFHGNTCGAGGDGVNPGNGGWGGALSNVTSDAIITFSLFISNAAGAGGEGGASGGLGGGGGAVNNIASSLTIAGCKFRDNAAGNGGSGTLHGGSGGSGGAIANNPPSPLTVFSCDFVGNAAGDGESSYSGGDGGWGGAILSLADGAVLANDTFVNNRAGNGAEGSGGSSGVEGLGGALCDGEVTSTIVNSILRGDSPSEISGAPIVTYSNVEGGHEGEGNIDADPLLLNFGQHPWTLDLHLRPGSPCIDAGDSAALPADTVDLDGDEDTGEAAPIDLDRRVRVLDDGVDIGAYEFGELTEGDLAVTAGVGVSATAVIRFDDFLDVDTVGTPANFSISPAIAVTTSALGSDPRTVELTLGSALDWCSEYTATASGVTDYWGNGLGEDTEVTFRAGIVELWDPFEDTDLDGWTVVDSGDTGGPSLWEVEDGRMYESSSISGGTSGDTLGRSGTVLLWNDTSALDWEDYRVQVTLGSSTAGDIGIVFRYIDPNNYYKLVLSETGEYTALIRMAGGSEETLATQGTGYSRDIEYVLNVSIVGDTISCEMEVPWGMMTLFSVPTNDPTPLTSGTIGLYSADNPGAWFDSVAADLDCP